MGRDRAQSPPVEILTRALRPWLGAVRAISFVSSTNNVVYRLTDSEGISWAVKCVTDPDIDLNFLIVGNRRLKAAQVDAVPLTLVEATRSGLNVDCLLHPWVPGLSVAELLEAHQLNAQSCESAAAFLLSLQIAATGLEPPVSGLGLYKHGRKLSPDMATFINSYLLRYAGRLGMTLDRPFWNEAQALLRSFFDRRVSSTIARVAAVPFDANLRNLIVDDTGRIVLLGLPIVARADIRLGSGALSAHVAETPLMACYREVRASLAPELVPEPAVEMFYEALTLIGVAAFYCREDSESVRNARAWGSGRPLLRLILERLDALAAA